MDYIFPKYLITLKTTDIELYKPEVDEEYVATHHTGFLRFYHPLVEVDSVIFFSFSTVLAFHFVYKKRYVIQELYVYFL